MRRGGSRLRAHAVIAIVAAAALVAVVLVLRRRRRHRRVLWYGKATITRPSHFSDDDS
jgi:hypothetical protein